MNKPNWTDAPEWAQWLAQDSDGEWYWFEEEPMLAEDRDDTGDGVFMYPVSEYKFNILNSELAGKDCYNPNWRDTLESRPSKDSDTNYWNGNDWPIPAGSTCVIKGFTSGIPGEAVVGYMDEEHCIWHWTNNDGTTIHNLVKYMEFSPVKSETEKAREKVFSQLEEFTGNDCSTLMRTDVVEFVLKYYVQEK